MQVEAGNWEKQIQELKTERKVRSAALQQQLFEQFRMLNYRGEVITLCDIFEQTVHKTPPAGAGECAAPKLLQQAYLHHWKPIAMAEFWWGNSPKNEVRHHGYYYPACKGKCEPILRHMLQGLEVEANPMQQEAERGNEKLNIVYEDQWLLIINKPAGMLSQRAKASDDSLNDYLIDYCIQTGIISKEELAGFRPSIANRLDRNTSGIVLAGISIKGLQRLASMLRERTLGKYYLCLVEGKVKEDARIAGYLTKEEKNNKVSLHKEKAEGASYIETEYKVLKSTDKASLLKIRLITGKSHQIRGHLASVGHPVFGDYKYGNRDFNNQIKWKDGVNYQLLHSYELVVPEGTGELSGLHIIDPVPEVFHKVQTRWGLEVPELSYENEAKNRETDNKRAGNTRTGRTTNKKTENARTEKIRKSRRK